MDIAAIEIIIFRKKWVFYTSASFQIMFLKCLKAALMFFLWHSGQAIALDSGQMFLDQTLLQFGYVYVRLYLISTLKYIFIHLRKNIFGWWHTTQVYIIWNYIGKWESSEHCCRFCCSRKCHIFGRYLWPTKDLENKALRHKVVSQQLSGFSVKNTSTGNSTN